MARRAALIVLVFAFGLLSCGSKDWSCTWTCSSDMTHGSATYPDGTADPTAQCTADHGVGCNDFDCNCNQ